MFHNISLTMDGKEPVDKCSNLVVDIVDQYFEAASHCSETRETKNARGKNKTHLKLHKLYHNWTIWNRSAELRGQKRGKNSIFFCRYSKYSNVKSCIRKRGHQKMLFQKNEERGQMAESSDDGEASEDENRIFNGFTAIPHSFPWSRLDYHWFYRSIPTLHQRHDYNTVLCSNLGTWAFHQCCMQTGAWCLVGHLWVCWYPVANCIVIIFYHQSMIVFFRQAYIQFKRDDKLYSCGGAVVSNRCWWYQKITITTTSPQWWENWW